MVQVGRFWQWWDAQLFVEDAHAVAVLPEGVGGTAVFGQQAHEGAMGFFA